MTVGSIVIRRLSAATLLGVALAGGASVVATGVAHAAAPSVGAQCIGADIGRKTVAADGTRIVCDEYRWRVDNGQRPSHSWADDQPR